MALTEFVHRAFNNSSMPYCHIMRSGATEPNRGIKMIWFLFVISSQVVFFSSGSSFEDMKALVEYLEGNNTKNIRPRYNQSNPLDVYVQVRLYSIVDFDVSKGRLTLALSFLFKWLDELKSWNRTKFGGISRVRLPAEFVFIPDMTLYISLSERNKLIGNDVTKENVEINHSGDVYVVVNGVFEILCEPDIKMFPFDRHTCPLEIPANRPHTEVSLNTNSAVLDEVLQKNSRWFFESSTYQINETVGRYHILRYNITFHRYSFFLSLNLVVPVCILTIVNPLVFLLPLNSGEKVSFSITILLSFVVFVSSVSDKLPEVSEPVCMFNTFIIAQLVYSSLITFTVIVLSRSEGDTDIHLKFMDCNCCGDKTRVGWIKDENEISEKMQIAPTRSDTMKKCSLGSCTIACFVGFLLFAVVEIIVMVGLVV
ncbi:hypothetical protein FSP39_000544 [Pinctada imbricata]|uniref:Uncharacterized protein n=1 Tax=Pinctada imbricata TaxID=66713 RepID=A0AA89BVL1_PINIB|nr:hypothetical protein FSP39_000544 [Pinctada imbricata]